MPADPISFPEAKTIYNKAMKTSKTDFHYKVFHISILNQVLGNIADLEGSHHRIVEYVHPGTVLFSKMPTKTPGSEDPGVSVFLSSFSLIFAQRIFHLCFSKKYLQTRGVLI